MTDTTVLYGPPGTGKTSRLLSIMEQEIESGVDPRKIAFVSFTKAAVAEAASRAKKKFAMSEEDLPWFRTLHSLAFCALGLGRGAVMTDFEEFALENGFSFARRKDGLDTVFAERSGDELLEHARSLRWATGLPLAEIVKRWRLLGVSEHRYDTYCARLKAWKASKRKIDYADMIDLFVRRAAPIDVDVALIDEAQDLTPAQWRMTAVAFAGARRVYIAGDDDQAIYQWAGADALRMLAFSGKTIVLDRSYRLPRRVHSFANRIAARILTRKSKEWCSTEEEGRLDFGTSLNTMDFENGERWMLLARTGMTIPGLARVLSQRGIPHRVNGESAATPEEIEAYRGVLALRAGKKPTGLVAMRSFGAPPLPVAAEALEDDEAMLPKMRPARRRYLARLAARGKLLSAPLVDVSTIHRAKGAEADNVVLAPELSRATHDALRSPEYSDAEHRVWYVGATRAKKRLMILRPEAEFQYLFPSIAS